MLRGCKIRIYPTKKQEEILLLYCKYSHIMRNFLVAKFKDNLPKVNTYGIVNYNEQQLIKDFGETEILLPKRVIKGVLKNYAESVRRVYIKSGKSPKFHKYNPNKQSFYLPAHYLKINNFSIRLPAAQGFSVTGMSKIIVDKTYIEQFKITKIIEPRFSKIKNHWYVSGSYQDNFEPVLNKDNPIIGLDWGIKNFMTTSSGKYINYPQQIVREYQRIKKLQSFKDKKEKGSNNYKKIKNKITKAYSKLDNIKKNFIEQTTTKLAKKNAIAVENLTNQKIRLSSKNRRRLQLLFPLTNFIIKLEWKCKKFGNYFYKVNPAYTSQICSCCGRKMNLTLKDRQCKCLCGNKMDRDINAAINIAEKAVCGSL